MGNKLSNRKGRHFKNSASGSDLHHSQSVSKLPDALPPQTAISSRYDANHELTTKISKADPISSKANSHLSVNVIGQPQTSGSLQLPRSSLQDRHNDVSPAFPGPTYSGGLFANASNLKFEHPTMAEHLEVVHGGIHHHYRDPDILEKMRIGHVIIEAEFDSSDREYAPRCHPGTRIRFLEELKERIRSRTRIIWIFGPAGVGKSAIMQTLTEMLCKHPAGPLDPPVICLSFFFSRLNERNDPKKVFPTLAYRLAIANPEYRRYLEENFVADPHFLAKNLDEQFRRLFIDPIVLKHIGAFTPCVIFLDGLDEAEGLPAQSHILELIQGFIYHDKNLIIPISWVIASRPEPHLRTAFFDIEETIPNDLWKLEIPIDSDEAVRDLEIYIRAAFLKIRKAFLDVLPANWPPEADLLKVTTTSNGLFVFGATCMAYIGDEYPVERLDHIVGLIDHYRAESKNARPDVPKNPFEILDALYFTILNGISSDTLPTTKAMLGFHLLGKEITGAPPFAVSCRILGYKTSKARAALRGLHSVLRCPPQDDTKIPLKFLHASFSDFLRDKTRSGKYWIDVVEELKRLWRCYVREFRDFVRDVLPELKPLSGVECRKRVISDVFLDNHSKYNWLRLLSTHCHALPCSCGISYHLVLGTAELVGVFEELSPVLICPETRFQFWPGDVVDWLSNSHKHAPLGLLERVYRRATTLDGLTGSDFDCILRGLRSGRSATWAYNTFTKFDTTDFKYSTTLKDIKKPVTVLIGEEWSAKIQE